MTFKEELPSKVRVFTRSQLRPEIPDSQVHMYLERRGSVHTPSFIQGIDVHSSISTSQFTPFEWDTNIKYIPLLNDKYVPKWFIVHLRFGLRLYFRT